MSEDPTTDLAAQSTATSEEIAELYDNWAGSGGYDRDVSDWGYVAPERVADMTVTALTGVPGEVLDAGCGTGRVGVELHAHGVRNVLGGDFTPESITAARRRDVYTSVVHLDLNEPLPYPDDRFAVTVSVGVFTYLSDTDATIRELVRIVKPRGTVIFTQRTDLWAERDCDRLLDRLVDDGLCTVEISDPQPYLPENPDFGDTIRIRYVTLVASG